MPNHIYCERADYKGIANNAFKAAHPYFIPAARKAKEAVLGFIANGDVICNTTPSQIQKLKELQFLMKGVNGEFVSKDEFYRSTSTIWEDYLEEIGRRDHGFGCAVKNCETIDKLIRQNGPKKMEKRLKKHLQRRMDNAVKVCKL